MQPTQARPFHHQKNFKMENTALTTIQALDVSKYAGLLTTFKDRFSVHSETQKRALQVPYSLESKPRFDQFKALIKKEVGEFETGRKEFTRKLDEVKKLFPAAEQEMLALLEPIDQMEANWKRAELTKQQADLAEQAKAATKIRVVAEFVPRIEAMLIDLVYDAKVAYLDMLEKNEEAVAFVMNADTWQGLCRRAMNAIGGQDFSMDLVAAIAPRKEGLIASTTQSIHEFQAEADKSKGNKKALQAIGRTLGVSYSEQVAEAVENAEAAKVEAEMEIAETAQIAAPEVVIGTKFIPKPKDHKQVLEIFRHWLVEANPSVDEAAAQVSKAVTMCKREALKGTKWGGVDYIEDVK